MQVPLRAPYRSRAASVLRGRLVSRSSATPVQPRGLTAAVQPRLAICRHHSTHWLVIGRTAAVVAKRGH